jgi:hypothetical protein
MRVTAHTEHSYTQAAKLRQSLLDAGWQSVRAPRYKISVRIVDSKDQTVTVLHLAPQAAEVLITEASPAQPDAELAAELQAAALASQEKGRQQAAEMARILNCTDYYQVLLLLTLLTLLLLLQLLRSAAGNAATDAVFHL